ncbi:MAG: zinc ribbon domain-containing protein [Ruminococcus sp.]|nr:zinc ribbon domain-containing protein [Ruminococcus sp.]MCI5617480.1 zinc ribbon domain-containing protein [Ruminococcus sp.]
MGIFDNFQNAIGTASNKLNNAVSKQGTTTQQSNGKVSYCCNCGTKLNEGAQFCHGCGSPVAKGDKISTNNSTIPPVPQSNVQERTQKYVGKILKCPHCGCAIEDRTIVCPDCGMHITGKVALASVQQFKEQLMQIESERKKNFLGVFISAADPVDMKKLSLIRSFPIPNTVDDILEFVFLAIANIDVTASKKTAMNKLSSWGKSEETSMTITKTISDAWVAKLQQAYQKSSIAFPDDPVFLKIQKIYFEKMKELKIKVK